MRIRILRSALAYGRDGLDMEIRPSSCPLEVDDNISYYDDLGECFTLTVAGVVHALPLEEIEFDEVDFPSLKMRWSTSDLKKTRLGDK